MPPSKPSAREGSNDGSLPKPIGRSSAQEVLDLLAASGAMSAGTVNTISLEPIEQRLGERWARKRAQVWDHVESFLRRQFRAEDLIIRLDDLHVLIVQPGREPLTAQSLCVRACADLMKFFIGESPSASVRINIVEGFEQDTLVCSPLPLERLESMLVATRSDLGKPARVNSFPVLTRLGRSLSVELSMEPLWNLQPTPRIIGHHARSVLLDAETGDRLEAGELTKLQAGDRIDVDLAVLKDALALRAASPRLMGGLIIPVSYLTLANSSTRFQLLQEVQRIAPADRRSFGWEIVELEEGVPVGRLSELVSIARQHSRGVMCQMQLTVANAQKVRAAGATLSVPSPSDHVPYNEYSLFRMEAAATSAVKCVRALLLHKVPVELLPIASFIGSTHCTLASAA